VTEANTHAYISNLWPFSKFTLITATDKNVTLIQQQQGQLYNKTILTHIRLIFSFLLVRQNILAAKCISFHF